MDWIVCMCVVEGSKNKDAEGINLIPCRNEDLNLP